MIPQIKEIKDIALEDLVVGKGQVRVKDVKKDIEDLAESIRVVGLLQPIIVCPSEQKKGKYEILAGQRRFLAHVQLKRATIKAAVLESRVDEHTAKALSLIENLVRRSISTKETIDACTSLYMKYGTMKAVSEELGLKENLVSQYVKFARLPPKLKKMVEANEVDIKTALRAVDAAGTGGKVDETEAVTFAKELAPMSGEQQKRVVKQRQDDPEIPVEEVLEAAKSSAKVTQIVVTLSATTHKSLQAFASEDSVTQDEAAAALIEDGLKEKGFEV
ncbi:MAG: ParB/RepB/Spo0J family partition protein [Myxococcales bacterium]